MKYRSDIDGLRAVSVILVLLFHADLFGATGGFIGVDVFFVISGYLITSIILRHLEQGDFSLSNFYERRVRRIFPALVAVLSVSLITAWLIMMPKEFGTFGGGLAATAAFSSNILFWRESGYFDLGSEMKPLLHMWSIAVEEQFYIFFPLYLMLLYKWLKPYIKLLTMVGLVLSFGLSIWMLSIEKNIAAFYLLPPRAWELAAGSILAMNIYPKIAKKESFAHIYSIIGLGLIIVSAFTYSKGTAFPGIAASAPVIGAYLIILAGIGSNKAIANKVLSVPPLVFIGKISYSLYLWHWPVLVFSKYYLIRELVFYEKLLALVICIILAALSWKFIEQPFRTKKAEQYKGKAILITVIIFIFVFGAAGLAIKITNGVPSRIAPHIVELSDAQKGMDTDVFGLDGFKWSNRLVGDDKAAEFTYLIWGDSHSNALAPALSKASKQHGQKGLLLKRPGCMSAVNLKEDDLNATCAAFNKAVLEQLKHKNFRSVFLINRWSAYPKWFSENSQKEGTEKSRAKFKALLSETIKHLTDSGIKVYILAEVPKVDVDQVPSVLARAERSSISIDLRPRLNTYMHHQRYIHKILEDIASAYDVTIIYPHQALCDKERCMVKQDNKSMYYDDDHLSKYGAEFIGDFFSPYFSGKPDQ